MNYKELIFTIISSEDYHKDLLINALSEVGFDTFEETVNGFKAYIPSDNFDQNSVEAALKNFDGVFNASYEMNFIPEKNWNEVWESNFNPLIIKDQCYVRATFHEARPEYPYEIVVDPKMAFGTGHHQTTSMMMEYILEEDLQGKSVLDMGCGTGILSILASKRGADPILAIDYDPLCYDSTIENSRLNNSLNITALRGSVEAIPDGPFDLILANINRNILLDQIGRYAQVLKPGGLLFLSGFYENPDLDILKEENNKSAMSYVNHKAKDEWVAAKFLKESF